MEKKIGSNKSSGAKKVERIEEFTPETVNEQTPAAKPVKKPSAKKQTAQKSAAEKKERAAAKERVEKARSRSEKKQKEEAGKAALKQKKLEKRAAYREKKLAKRAALLEKRAERKRVLAEKRAARIAKRAERRAEVKKQKVERRAERIARRELLKNESAAEKNRRIAREKRERYALRKKRAEARENARKQKRASRSEAHSRRAEAKRDRREKRTPGFGGWLAAVISLGTACLALATVVTAGAFRMNDMTVAAESGYRATLYEMVSASESLDDSLSKLRVSSGSAEQQQLLSDILVDAELMESALERMPVDSMTGTDLSAFVNRTAAYARMLLSKLSRGEKLSAGERETLSRLYETNDKLYGELNDLATHLKPEDFRAFIGGKEGALSDRFHEMAEGTHGEETSNAPFSKEGNVGENALSALEEISSGRAEELVLEYFAAYRVQSANYTGETVAREIACYDFVLTDENGTELFAQISKHGGKLVFFDTYEPCSVKNFDLPTCDAIAREYLAGLGIGDVEAVWLSDGGMVADLTYTTVSDGVRVYPEMIRIRVCEEKGRVIGMDVSAYLLNRTERTFEGGMTEEEARRSLAEGLEPYAARLALIPVYGKEVLAYEFGCKYGDDEYIVYIDAKSGEEVRIFLVRESAGGSYLR